MAINRGPFNALVDDGGTGTTGTPWNKQAIKDVILDPVDAALTTGTVLTVLGSATGTDSAAGPTQMSYFATPALVNSDTLLVSGVAVNGAASAITRLDLVWYDPSSSTTVQALNLTGLAGSTAATPFPSGSVLTWRVLFRPTPGSNNMQAIASGVIQAGVTQALGASFGGLSAANMRFGPGYLYYQHSGVTGGALTWTWSVHLLKG